MPRLSRLPMQRGLRLYRRDDRPVEPNSKLGTDPHRLDSYTQVFREYQVANFFKGNIS
jgi:hypothetical protein